MKIVFQFVLVMIILVSTIAVYFSSQKQKFSSVELNSYVENEVTGSSPFPESSKIKPLSEQQIIDAVMATTGPVTISGVHHSLGGQITYPDSLYLDMSEFDKVLGFDTEKKLITVQTGISWSQIQQVIDPHNLSVKIMQDNNDYSVGGSLSVNAHGRFIGAGRIINSVKSIRIVLPDGKVYDASPEQNTALFYGSIGGYGGVGVIVQATLELVDNIAIERSIKSLSFHEFNNYFTGNILNDDSVVLHQAVLYPPSYESLLDISWRKTDKSLTDERRLREDEKKPWWESVLLNMKSKSAIMHRFQKNLIDPYLYNEDEVVNLNFETSHSLSDSGFISSEKSTMVLQEYLIPTNRFEIFVFNLRDIFSRHNADIYKVLISYVKQDKVGVLADSASDVYSFKIIYRQEKNKNSSSIVENWTKELVRASIDSHGTHILPYLIKGPSEQLYKSYPESNYLFELKKKADPTHRFRNLFWEQHHQAVYNSPAKQMDMPVSSLQN